MPGFLRRPTFYIIIVVVLLLGGGLFYAKTQAAQKKKQLETAAAQEEPSPYAAIANGKADVEGGVIQVAARRQGIVREVYAQEGDVVVAGQPLAKQEDDEPRLASQTATANLASARAQLALYQVQLRTAQREYKRLQNLAASNFVAAQRLDAAQDAIAQATANIGAQTAAISVANAQLSQSKYQQELTVIRAPANGRIARRYANPGAGASTLNVTSMFDLEPNTQRIVRAEIVEADIPNVKVLRRAAVFGARKLASDDPSQRSDERVVEVVVSADSAPLLVGQRVLVKFMKPGQKAGIKRDKPAQPVAGGMSKKKA
jgi:multidrug resistance efflux pump